MKVILTEKIDKLGDIGKTIHVKNGYAKNYLIPNKKAITASKKNIFLQKDILKKIQIDEKNLKIYKNIENTTIFFSASAKKDNELYVNINSNKMLKILNKLNIPVKTKNLINNIEIKKTGKYKIEIKTEDKSIISLHMTIIKINK